jgi:hypothetical protein
MSSSISANVAGVSAQQLNVAGPGLAVSGVFNVKCQPIAFANIVRIDACGLQSGNVEKYIRTAGVVCDKTKTPIGIPHFQFAGGHFYFPFFNPGCGRGAKDCVPSRKSVTSSTAGSSPWGFRA